MAQRISMVSGVSSVQVYGAQKYAVRVQVNPDELAARGIGIDEVQQAIAISNTNLPTGKFDGDKQAFTVKSSGATDQRRGLPAPHRGLPQRRSGASGRIRQRNRRRREQQGGRAGMDGRARHHPGRPAAARNQHRRSRGRHQALLPQLRREIPPSVNLKIAYDASESDPRSIDDVEFTLMLTVCLVVMVIFLFLRNISATLIPGRGGALSIIGTFAVMYLLGYSLNNLSLMALTLSVGFVVDDAIVMLENIVRHMEMGETRMQAALLASQRNRLHDSFP